MSPKPPYLNAKATQLEAGHDDTLDAPPGTDPAERSVPPTQWPVANMAKGDTAPSDLLPSYLSPAQHPNAWAIPPVPNRPLVTDPKSLITLDPDLACWPTVEVPIWPWRGPPTAGIWVKGWLGVDNSAEVWVCTIGGEPGTWGSLGTGGGGPSGPQGPVGPAGPPGPQGSQGNSGPMGPAGATGAQGATGATGATGPAGPTGPAGTPGTPGVGVPSGGTAGQVLTNASPGNPIWAAGGGGGAAVTIVNGTPSAPYVTLANNAVQDTASLTIAAAASARNVMFNYTANVTYNSSTPPANDVWMSLWPNAGGTGTEIFETFVTPAPPGTAKGSSEFAWSFQTQMALAAGTAQSFHARVGNYTGQQVTVGWQIIQAMVFG